MIEVKGKCGISAKVLKHSVCRGIELLTFETEYPRLVLAELNTHRGLSKNSFSSRAVPFTKMVDNLTGRPVRFGANQAGMQDKGEDFNAPVKFAWDAEPMTVEEAWDFAREEAVATAEGFYKAGYHKQVYNRLLEPFQMMKTIISGTEWNNFFWLRDHDAADPTLAELARVMRLAKEQGVPVELKPGEWHLPYVETFRVPETGELMYHIVDDDNALTILTLEEAIKVSSARCAAVSFRNVDYGLDKSTEVYGRLVGDDRKHASALEHQATPMDSTAYGDGKRKNVLHLPGTWEEGISHMDRNGQLWSGNFRQWVQHRKLIPGENKEN